MDPALIGAVSAIFGGVVVASVNFLATRKKIVAEARRLDAETDSLLIETKLRKAEVTRLLESGGERHPREVTSDSSDIEGLGGWFAAGTAPERYKFGVDRVVVYEGSASGFIWSRETATNDVFGTLMQKVKAEAYRGKRYRLSAYVRTEDVTSWACLWMRVDGGKDNKTLAFDNMVRRPITGTTRWRLYRIVLDVADSANYVAFGILLNGPGRVWIDAVTFEAVDDSVGSTGDTLEDYPDHPMNLDFEGHQ